MKVTAKVLAHVRGEKLRVFKFKPKRGYKRRTGHRQELTQIEVTEIATGRRKAAKAAGEGENAPSGAAKPRRRPNRPPRNRPAAKAARPRKPRRGAAARKRKPARARPQSESRRGRTQSESRRGRQTGAGPQTPRSTGTKATKETTDDGS